MQIVTIKKYNINFAKSLGRANVLVEQNTPEEKKTSKTNAFCKTIIQISQTSLDPIIDVFNDSLFVFK